jgi:periplasmic divalent cation tolerance protein
MTDFILVQTSSNSQEGAQKIADAIIARRLAACCWVSGPMVSTYWWKGRVDQEQEWACSFKTQKDLYRDIEQAIKEVHSYEVPEIVAIPLVAGSQSYLDWIEQETKHEDV